MKLTVAELFAGVGGFRVGLNSVTSIDAQTGRAIEKGPWSFVWANQWEPSTKAQPAFGCYSRRFGEENHSNADIHAVKKDDLPDFNLLTGGFPCQDYSVARSLSGEKGIEGKKGVLFWQIRDTLVAKHPPFVLLENVDRLLKSPSTQRGRDFAVMLRVFDDLGYDVQWRIINAADYGMPQRRRRIFIFAYDRQTLYAQQFLAADDKFQCCLLNQAFPLTTSEQIHHQDLRAYVDLPQLSSGYEGSGFESCGYTLNGQVWHTKAQPIPEKPTTLGQIVDRVARECPESKASSFEGDKLEKMRYLKGAKKIERLRPNGEPYIYSEGPIPFPDSLDEPGRTMLTSEGTINRSTHIIKDQAIFRALKPEEAEALQMFPLGWTNTMTTKQRFFMMGNALVTGVINRLEPHLRKVIEREPELSPPDASLKKPEEVPSEDYQLTFYFAEPK